jgi:hypothetical protein
MRRFTREAPTHRRRESFRHLARDNHLAAFGLEKSLNHLIRVAVAANIEKTLFVRLQPGASL